MQFMKVAYNGPSMMVLALRVITFCRVANPSKQMPVADDFYYIVPDKCTECVGFHEEPQCAAVCPVDCCVPDPDRVESKELLLGRKEALHV
jgi:ferredoxin